MKGLFELVDRSLTVHRKRPFNRIFQQATTVPEQWEFSVSRDQQSESRSQFLQILRSRETITQIPVSVRAIFHILSYPSQYKAQL